MRRCHGRAVSRPCVKAGRKVPRHISGAASDALQASHAAQNAANDAFLLKCSLKYTIGDLSGRNMEPKLFVSQVGHAGSPESNSDGSIRQWTVWPWHRR